MDDGGSRFNSFPSIRSAPRVAKVWLVQTYQVILNAYETEIVNEMLKICVCMYLIFMLHQSEGFHFAF